MKSALRLILVAVVATSSLAAVAPSANAANRGYAISRGTTMYKGDYLHRDMGGWAVELIMQPDGNLVLKATNGHVCWAAGTNPSGYKAAYQSDGNFVVYNSSGRALWASNTVGASWDTGQTVSINAQGTLYVGYKKISTCYSK
ncbi:hypothetical protein ABZ467_27980 [Streptomyces sp. NPDC005727]|uniref:hypothetical protein n=1 Tax=Streptomyces sp. NPDC005727 TaxID=3157053 RepID=UPI00340B8DBE